MKNTLVIFLMLAVFGAITPCIAQNSRTVKKAPGNITVQKDKVTHADNPAISGTFQKSSLFSATGRNNGVKTTLRKATVKKLPLGFQNKSTSTSIMAGVNLFPYKPSEWDNIIVLSSQEGTFTTSATINNNQAIFVDCAFANGGESDISETFYIDVFFDGDLAGSFFVEGLASGYYAYFEDAEFWPLSSGSHTFKVVVDSEGNVSETNEGDNEYSRSKTIGYAEPCVNLEIGKPDEWEDVIIVSTTEGTTVSSPTINSSQPVFVDLAFANGGGCGISPDFDVRIYVDDVAVDTFVAEGLESHVLLSIYDREIGTLTAGSHTLRIVLDAGHVVNEFNETDNEFSQTIQVGEASSCMNVIPYKPAGWDNKIVLSTTTGTSTSTTGIIDNQDIFLDWAITNNGSCATAKSIKVKVYVDNVVKSTFTAASLGAGTSTSNTDIAIGKLSAGEHTIKVVADADAELTETNESDNEYSLQVTILASACADLIPFQPDEWDDAIVLSTVTETTTSATVFYSNEPIFIDLALLNSGSCEIPDTFLMGIYIDNILKDNFLVDGLLSDYYVYITDVSYGTLTAGEHTFKLVADGGHAIPESNENDNEYSRTITVLPVTGVEGPAESLKINVYPNPFRDQLVIGVSNNNKLMEYELLNSVGQQIMTGRFVDSVTVPASNLKPGFYLIRLNDGDTIYQRKVIRE
jgi:subtilase family serine protease